ncbi:MAG: hypothetical protein R2762_07210 [Bryobacteraceae bacterium]
MRDHVSDGDLLLYAACELDGERCAAVDNHVGACPVCAHRIHYLEESVAEFAQLESSAVDPYVPSPEPARARLAAQLARPRRWALAFPAMAAAILLVITGAALLLRRGPDRHVERPDPGLTPGSIVSTSAQMLCAEPEREPPPIDPAVAKSVFDRYGIAPAPGNYELDYLVTPALGGSADASNLWPQRYDAGEWNSRVKDALEDRLRSMVCSGEVDLATAQSELAADWIGAYRRRFGTARPLLNHFAFVKDRPWE